MLSHGRFRPRSKVLHIPTTAQLAGLEDQSAKYKIVLARMNITSFQPFTQRQDLFELGDDMLLLILIVNQFLRILIEMIMRNRKQYEQSRSKSLNIPMRYVRKNSGNLQTNLKYYSGFQ